MIATIPFRRTSSICSLNSGNELSLKEEDQCNHLAKYNEYREYNIEIYFTNPGNQKMNHTIQVPFLNYDCVPNLLFPHHSPDLFCFLFLSRELTILCPRSIKNIEKNLMVKS